MSKQGDIHLRFPGSHRQIEQVLLHMVAVSVRQQKANAAPCFDLLLRRGRIIIAVSSDIDHGDGWKQTLKASASRT